MKQKKNLNNKKNQWKIENKGYNILFQTFRIEKYDFKLKKIIKRTRNLEIY